MFDALNGLLSGNGMAGLLKTGTAIAGTLLVIPALIKLFLVTVDEGSAAIRTRNGKPIIRRAGTRRGSAGDVVVLAPGSHAAFPLLWWYRIIDVRTRSTDLPVRELTGADDTQHRVHASFDWRPLVTGHDLRVFELDVVSVKERAGNIVSAALRDIVRSLPGSALPANDLLSPAVVDACRDRVRTECGIELLRVMVTGDALTDGYLLATALRSRADDPTAIGATMLPSLR